MADELEVEVVSEETLAEEKAAWDQAVAGLDGRTEQVVAKLMGLKAAPVAACQLEAAPGEGLSVGTVTRIERNVLPGGSEGSGREMRVSLLGAGITADKLAMRLGQGLRASKTVILAGRMRRIPDFAVRLKYLELAHKLRGDLVATAGDAGAVSTYEERILAIAQRITKTSA